jgi:hypothetical protein
VNVSFSTVTSKVSEPATAPRMSCSVVRCKSRPLRAAPPETVLMRKEGVAKTLLPDLTVEEGSVSVIVSGASVS